MNPTQPTLTHVARFPGLRALAWNNTDLYASRGYELLRAKIENPSNNLKWQTIAKLHPAWHRRVSVTTRLTARLLRDGFHALAVLPSGGIVAAVPGAIVVLGPNEKDFQITHRITRGTRPLHITTVPNGTIYWGEYFDNPNRDEVHIHASTDAGTTWSVAYTFPKRTIRHIHNIAHDPWTNCLWILTGDNGGECRILRSSLDLSKIETILQGNQQARAVALVVTEAGLYFSSDTPLERNFIYHLNRKGDLVQLAPITSSSIYGCRAANRIFFSTMVEPSQVNPDRQVRIYASDQNAQNWHPQLAWKKDSWPQRLFQYGNAFLPDGPNTTPYLAVSTIAVESDDMTTSLYAIE